MKLVSDSVPVSTGWFAGEREGRALVPSPRPRGDSLPLMMRRVRGRNVLPDARDVDPGAPAEEPNATYHGETEQEDFLVLAGEGLLIVEGQERPLVKQWDFVHCSPETRHAFVGVGDEPCVILAVSSRQFQKGRPVGALLCRRGRASLQRERARGHSRTARSRTGDSRHRSRRAIATVCCRTSRRFSS